MKAAKWTETKVNAATKTKRIATKKTNMKTKRIATERTNTRKKKAKKRKTVVNGKTTGLTNEDDVDCEEDYADEEVMTTRTMMKICLIEKCHG